MTTDQKNRDAVRKGYLLPVGIWLQVMPQNCSYCIPYYRSYCQTVSQTRNKSYTQTNNGNFRSGSRAKFGTLERSLCWSRIHAY